MLMETASAPRTPPHEESDTESEGEQDQRKDRSTPRKHHHQHHQHHPQKEQQQLVRQQQEMQYEAQEPLTGNSFTLEPQRILFFLTFLVFLHLNLPISMNQTKHFQSPHCLLHLYLSFIILPLLQIFIKFLKLIIRILSPKPFHPFLINSFLLLQL